MHQHWWKKFPECCGKKQGNLLLEVQWVVLVNDLRCLILLWNPVPQQQRNLMSHVGVSPKLSGSSCFLLLLAGSRSVRVFSSAETQTFAACCFFTFFLKKKPTQNKLKKFLPLGSETAQTTGFPWCFVSPTTDVKWPWSQATADLMLRLPDRDRVKTSPPRIHSTDPAQPMKRAAPSSNLFTRGGEVRSRRRLSFVLYFPSFFAAFFFTPKTYFCATKSGSKKSVVILWA